MGLHGLTRRRTYNAPLGFVSSEIVNARDPLLDCVLDACWFNTVLLWVAVKEECKVTTSLALVQSTWFIRNHFGSSHFREDKFQLIKSPSDSLVKILRFQ